MKLVSVLPLSISLIALAFAVHSIVSLTRGVPQAQPAGIEAQLAGINAQLDDLRAQGDRIAEQLDAIRREMAPLAERSSRPAVAPAESATASPSSERKAPQRSAEELVSRLEDLAARLESTAAAPRGVVVVPQEALRTETADEKLKAVAAAQEIALDASRRTGDRLQAFRDLRSRDGRSKEVVLAMIDLLRDPNLDPRVRADIIRNADGVTFEELKQPLIAVLQNDPDPETREEAIETLQAFYGDPAVHAAVAHTRDNDQNPRVRLEALRRLTEFEAMGARDGEGRAR